MAEKSIRLESENVVEDIRKSVAEIVAGICVLLIALMILYAKREFIISILACSAILAIGFERRSEVFDRIVAILAIFIICLGFIFI